MGETRRVRLEEVLDGKELQRVLRRVDALHHELADIASMLFILRRMAAFPRDHFWPYDGPLWTLVEKALAGYVVVGLWRLVHDGKNQNLTVRRVVEDVIEALDGKEGVEEWIEGLKACVEDRRLSTARRKIGKLRNKYFAHLDKVAWEERAQGGRPFRPVRYSELEEVLAALRDALDEVVPGTYHHERYPEYDDRVSRNEDRGAVPDIDEFLLDVVRGSREIYLPEGPVEEFRAFWTNLSTSARRAFNEYRRQLGMRPVPDRAGERDA